jgi:uncharacterized protein YecE (DUF72 family)
VTKPALFAGTSGWAYPTWKPGFYPREVPARKFLEHYAGRLNSVEVNYTFRKAVREDQLNGWLNATPLDFQFTFKAPDAITHVRRMRDCDQVLEEFLASLRPVVKAEKHGAVLLQLPPNFRAASLGKDKKTNFDALRNFMSGTQQLRSGSKWKFAIEFRDAGWFNDEVYALLRQHNVALCTAESDELRTPDVRTADFSYTRLRCSNYSAAQLEQVIGEQIQLAMQGEAYCYFKHEDAPDGPLRAEKLLHAWRERAQ